MSRVSVVLNDWAHKRLFTGAQLTAMTKSAKIREPGLSPGNMNKKQKEVDERHQREVRRTCQLNIKDTVRKGEIKGNSLHFKSW